MADLTFVSDDDLIEELARRWESCIVALDRVESKQKDSDGRLHTEGAFRVVTFASVASRIGLARLIMRHEEQEIDEALAEGDGRHAP